MWPTGLEMKNSREIQTPHESYNPSIHKNLKLIRFQHSPLKMSYNILFRNTFAAPRESCMAYWPYSYGTKYLITPICNA